MKYFKINHIALEEIFDNCFDTPDGRVIEIGVYREPDDGSYTLQIFDNDDVVVCTTIDKEVM